MPHFVDFGGRRLLPLDDIETTKKQIVEALRSGGDFVRLGSGSGDVYALIAPGTRIMIESYPDDDDTAAGAVGVETIYPTVDEFDEFGL